MARVMLLLLALVVLGCNAITWLNRMPHVGQLFATAAMICVVLALFAYMRGSRG